MTMIKVYLWSPGKKVILPTMAETEAGFFVETAPLKVFDTAQVEKWKKHLREMLSRSMQVIPTPGEDQGPGSLILEKLQLDSWSEFEKTAILFTVHKGARYISIYTTGKGEDGMWSHAHSSERKFYSRTPIDMVVDAIVQDIICHPETIDRPKTLLIGG